MILFSIVLFVVIILGLCTLRINNEYERSVIFSFGHFSSIQGPGIYMNIPLLRSVAQTIDVRIQTRKVMAEKILTKDTVSLDVEAVIQWHVVDTKLAILEVQNIEMAVNQISQTSLREITSAHTLDDLLHNREQCDQDLHAMLGKKTSEWGVQIDRVEIKDLTMDEHLRQAMGVQARAVREREARVTLAKVEAEVAQHNEAAAKIYETNPIAFRIRQMSVLKEISANQGVILIPHDLSDGFVGNIGLNQAMQQHTKE